MKGIITINIVVWMLLSIDGGLSHLYGMNPCGDSCSTSAQSQECMCRTYTIAVPLISPVAFLNSSTGEIDGPAVKLVKKICEAAGKLCKFAGVTLSECWSEENLFSDVLKGRRYDVCTSMIIYPPTLAKYDFMEHGMSYLGKAVIYARPGSNITAEVLRKPHDLRLGFFGSNIATFGMLDGYLDDGFYIKEKNIIYFDGNVDTVIDQFSSLSNCGNQIDFIYITRALLPPGNFTFVTEVNFDFGYLSIMVRKDEQCLKKWLDEAYNKVICSDEYPAFCQDLTESTQSFGDGTDFCLDRDTICS